MNARTIHALLLAALAALALNASTAAAHGVITWVKGANGVNMPGLGVVSGTPRDCAGNNCGAQGDTSIIREADFKVIDPDGPGTGSPLGRSQKGGPVMAGKAIANFMGTSMR